MAKDLNKVVVIGHLGVDPELHSTQQGTLVATFRVAASRTWTDAAGTRQEETEWFRVIAWEKLGEICNQYLQKGAGLYRRALADTNLAGYRGPRPRHDGGGRARYDHAVQAP
jgi:single stranded DNA-binding protein